MNDADEGDGVDRKDGRRADPRHQEAGQGRSNGARPVHGDAAQSGCVRDLFAWNQIGLNGLPGRTAQRRAAADQERDAQQQGRSVGPEGGQNGCQNRHEDRGATQQFLTVQGVSEDSGRERQKEQGSKLAVCPNAMSEALRSISSHWVATVCIHEPIFEPSWASHKIRNVRYDKGVHGEVEAGCEVAPEAPAADAGDGAPR